MKGTVWLHLHFDFVFFLFVFSGFVVFLRLTMLVLRFTTVFSRISMVFVLVFSRVFHGSSLVFHWSMCFGGAVARLFGVLSMFLFAQERLEEL